MDLHAWALAYMKHKYMYKQCVMIQDSHDIVVYTIDGVTYYVSIVANLNKLIVTQYIEQMIQQYTTQLKTNISKKNNDQMQFFLVVTNTQSNVDVVYDQWSSLHVLSYLTIIFVDEHKKWIVKPFILEKISGTHIQKALQSLFDNAV